jgi:serine/threonine protein kinase
MAVGKYPFIGDRQRVKRLITEADPKLPEMYKDKPLGNLIMKLLKKSPEDRIRITELK